MVSLIVFGLIATAGGVTLEEYLYPPPGSALHLHSGSELSWSSALLLKVLDHVGLGLFAAAILGVFIELPHA